uniref:Fibronectin type-III domain-containing protein n=1 Tax=Pygocentrus nattereri TaxID=42514 RepID=A0AAR2KUF9_PYGNA
ILVLMLLFLPFKTDVLIIKHISFTVKPLTPNNLTVSKADGYYIFKWTSGYEQHQYDALVFKYKLSYHKEGYPGSVSLSKTEFNISEAEFEAGTLYTAKVCSKIRTENDYNGTNSNWSSAVKWTTSHDGKYRVKGGLHKLSYHSHQHRMKIKDIIWVATPSPNFQSLLQNHQGNIKHGRI